MKWMDGKESVFQDPRRRLGNKLWAILAAPLLAGNDLREMAPGIAA